MELDLVTNGGGVARGEVARWRGKDGGKLEGRSLVPEERSVSS
jgi:hypothetical protein